MKQKIKQYLTWFKKGMFYAFVIITVFNIGLMIYFRGSEFRTLGYKIEFYASQAFGYLFIFWLWFSIIKNFACNYKENKIEIICIFIISCILGLLFTAITLTLINATNTEEMCMETCVSEDLSDYVECSLTVCS